MRITRDNIAPSQVLAFLKSGNMAIEETERLSGEPCQVLPSAQKGEVMFGPIPGTLLAAYLELME